ncbi:hydrogenase maturation nickel metallochaperone HypA [Catalinimonas sp. 4WD22]|uniref:hydrogenase maturation nickel metallochaperone HypA/HybF n=1 Tax=Catalinimonas locisalis TaxID=3133978 RepID=UPI0031011ACF
MHEISIARSMIRSLEAELDEAQQQALREIVLEVGELSCVEPILMQNAWEAVSLGSTYENVKLQIDKIATEVYCSICNKNFFVHKHRYVCPDCATPSNQIVKGNELNIRQVKLEESPSES